MANKINDYNFPSDLKEMSLDELNLLSYELRDFLISTIADSGGHLASNLGAVELTIALHKVFDTPKDKIIWDVGHQSYVHKILTGRSCQFTKLRQSEGLSGFPKRDESDSDCYNTGHSSTSISAAMGFAISRDLRKEDYNVISVIGDGAMTGGLAYEGMNNAGSSGAKMIVILNDNEMSISKNTGGMSQHLSKLRTSNVYISFKSKLKVALKKTPAVYNRLESFRDGIKNALLPGVIFEELGFKYLGPVDGHDIGALIDILEIAKKLNGPTMIHIITKKGKGYINAEKDPGAYHGIGPFDVETGKELASKKAESYSSVFGNKILELALIHKDIVAVSAAMTDATGLAAFKNRFPDRTFDVGIAEAHAVTFAAGMAASGMKPFVAIYSTFLQRAYDNIVLDVCSQKLPVVFAIDRAGNVGADGETHHGVFDLAYLRHLPNMVIMAPKDGLELEMMLDLAYELDSPVAIRYPRGKAEVYKDNKKLEFGKAEKLIDSQNVDVSIWAVGKMVSVAINLVKLLALRGIDASLVNARFIKPMDNELLREDAAKAKLLVTMEDNSLQGGFGESISAFLADNGINTDILRFGWPDKYIEHGSSDDLMKKYGLDADSIADCISNEVN